MNKYITTYGGSIGWFLRKYFSRFTSFFWLKLNIFLNSKKIHEYIGYFYKASEMPIPVCINIETINRCNNYCAFCPASIGNETRPFKQMSDILFKKIISDLMSWGKGGYSGYISLFVTNEPFMDKRIVEYYKYVKEHLPNCKLFLSTNGKLLTLEKWISILPYIDIAIINDYKNNLEVSNNIAEISRYMKDNNNSVDFTVQIRYINEILTSRGGSAPNKKYHVKTKEPCFFPFTDMVIFPDGKCGLCNCDGLERTNMGDCNKMSLQEIWQSSQYKETRSLNAKGRNNYEFCKNCDFTYYKCISMKQLKNKKTAYQINDTP